MAKITPEYIRDGFYRQYAKMPHPERKGIIEALKATDAVMCEARPDTAQLALPIDMPEPEPDSEGGEED